MLSYFCNQSLAKFETSIKHDNALLSDFQNYPRFSNKRNIVVMRLGEKEVLTYYAELGSKSSKYLSMTINELLKEKENDPILCDAGNPFAHYFENVIGPLVMDYN